MVYILLGEGFEEVEAVVPLKLLRRVEVDVATVSLSSDLFVRGGHGLVVMADVLLEQVVFGSLDMLVLPGGGAGVVSIGGCPVALELIRRSWGAGKLVAALCAAPSLLADLGFLVGKRVVCHPVVFDRVVAAGGVVQPDLAVVRDGNLITGRAAGSSFVFGLELVAALLGRGVSEDLRRGIFYD